MTHFSVSGKHQYQVQGMFKAVATAVLRARGLPPMMAIEGVGAPSLRTLCVRVVRANRADMVHAFFIFSFFFYGYLGTLSGGVVLHVFKHPGVVVGPVARCRTRC